MSRAHITATPHVWTTRNSNVRDSISVIFGTLVMSVRRITIIQEPLLITTTKGPTMSSQEPVNTLLAFDVARLWPLLALAVFNHARARLVLTPCVFSC